jgi:hypothetical protein
MIRKPLQTELELKPKRVKLLDDKDFDLHVDDSFVWADVGYTPYSKEKPPCTGYWEVTNTRGGAPIKRWYDAEKDVWMSGRTVGAEPFPFTEGMMWRGLAAPHVNGYTYRVRNLRVKLREGV